MKVRGTASMHSSFMNAVRVEVMTGVATLAMDSVFIDLNLSLLCDYGLPETIGLVPLQYPRSLVHRLLFVDGCECSEGKCPKCSIAFRLEASGPSSSSSASEELIVVKAKHIVVDSKECSVAPEALEQPLAWLSQDQHIRVSGYIHKSLFDDEEHAKFYPLSNTPALCGSPRIDIDSKLASQLTAQSKQELVKACPAAVLDIEDVNVVVKRPLQCTQCRACIDWCEDHLAPDQHKLIQIVDQAPYEILLEPRPSHSAQALLIEALESLKTDLVWIRSFCTAYAVQKEPKTD